MSEERKFEISEDILRALKIRRASVEADSETSQLMGDTEKTDRKRLCSAAAEEYEKGNYENAVKLWRTAAEYEDDYAQLCLAVCYGAAFGKMNVRCSACSLNRRRRAIRGHSIILRNATSSATAQTKI